MARLIVYGEFLDARNAVWSERVRANIDDMLRTIEQMPGVGSAIIPASVEREFEPCVRKAVVSPFEIIYEYDKATDTAYVYGLLYARGVA